MKNRIIIMLLSLIFTNIWVNAQQLTYNAVYPEYQIDIHGPSSPASTNSLRTNDGTVSQSILIGKANTIFYHAVFQWIIDDTKIPDGSTINSITVKFYTPQTCANINYFNTGIDITGSNLNLTTLWNSTDKNASTPAVPIGNGGYTTNGSYRYYENTYSAGSTFVNSFTNSLTTDYFSLGLAWMYESPNAGNITWALFYNPISLSVNYTPPIRTITLDQRLSDNTTLVGKLRKWEGTYFTPPPYINPGTPFDFPVGQPQTIQGDQGVYSNEKYFKWIRNTSNEQNVANHHTFIIQPNDYGFISKFNPTQSDITIKNSLEGTTLDGGEIRFKDPWYCDYKDPLYSDELRNRGMDQAIFHDRTSPFNPNSTVGFENNQKYNGIFSNQSGPPLWNNTYYSVGSLSEQTISVNSQNRKFYPFKWSGTGVTLQGEYSPETGIVFNNSSAVATATLKGQLMSNSTTGISSNSQRKMVRTDNGIYHVMYESMGNVFYTHSLTSNFDGEWAADQYILDHAKNPAIEYEGNIVKAVCEYYDPAFSTNVDLWLLTFEQQPSGIYENTDSEIFATCTSSYFGSAKPVISYNAAGVALVYRINSTEGLKVKTKWLLNGVWSWQAESTIPQTDANSINPSIIGETGIIHIAYESQSTIKYKLAYNQGLNWLYYNVITLSTGSGYTTNNYPSISLCKYTTPYVMVSWHGNYIAAVEKRLAKENDYSDNINAAVAKVGYGTSWGGFSSFSNNVYFTNNNSLNTSLGSILTWSETNGQVSKYVRRKSNGTYDPIASLSANGIQTLVSNGSSFDNMKVMVFNTSTPAPYLLNKCTDSFPLNKVGETKTVDISYGRSGVVEKKGIEFLFNTGDVLLDRQTIKFIERIDTLPVANLDELNTVARTESFVLNTQSELVFSNYYYVVNKNLADSILSNDFSVTFKCELVNASTNQVVGTFDNVTYNKLNIQEYNNQSYLIDCSGIETGNYYLRLYTTVNEDVNFFISDIQRDDIVLEKSNLLVRNFKGEGIPIVYDLAQNFPNPFNPSTTIRYQIPQDGIVTLKIYDILGSEVVTLINEEKLAGKYEVNFNASSLASGVYIYKIQAGSFINSKKMILLK